MLGFAALNRPRPPAGAGMWSSLVSIDVTRLCFQRCFRRCFKADARVSLCHFGADPDKHLRRDWGFSTVTAALNTAVIAAPLAASVTV